MTGEELKKKLKGERYSITDLAEKLGMTRPNLSQALSVKDVKTSEKIPTAITPRPTAIAPSPPSTVPSSWKTAKSLKNA